MRKNVNIRCNNSVYPAVFQDTKKPIPCRVDNFPADNPAYLKRDGFRCNDVSLLDRLSFNQNVDSDLVKLIASRIREVPKDNVNPDLSEKQLVNCLRPSWCQTPSEIKYFDEQVFQYMNTQEVEDFDVKSAVEDVNSESSVVNNDESQKQS